MPKYLKVNQSLGFTPIVILIAAVGILLFLFISNTFSFKDRVFKTLIPKHSSFASNPGIEFVDATNQPITQTITPTVRVQLTSPWSATIPATGFLLRGSRALPKKTPSPTPTPTPATTSSVLLAEDSGFTKNPVTITSFSSNPFYTSYTFSDPTLGTKTLYAKFISTDNQQQVFNNSIQLSLAATPTPTSGVNAHSMGRWTPSKWDTCTQSEHDLYKVMGSDGKWYPTWHPPIHKRADGTTCTFGHEHGRDPSQSLVWKQVKEFFYYDANKNGVMDFDEAAVAGLPFGYVNEQSDAYYASLGKTTMRHEDHVGHKIDWANDETDLATHKMSTTKNTGVWIGRAANGIISPDTGVRCFFLAKTHQGVSTPDAFTNNVHEDFYFQDCRYSDTAYNTKVSFAMMEGFGAPGGFTNFMPMCGIERRFDPQDRVCPLGKDASGNCILDPVNKDYPTDNGDREIITRDCIEKGFLVPEGQWSGNLYEAWPANLEVVKPDGSDLASGVNLLFDVEDANRYYYPDSLKQARGYNNPDAKPNLGFTMDLCYDNSLLSEGRKYRGGPCDWATSYGTIQDIRWDDPRSAFRGVHRGMYFQPAVLNNATGPEYWYTDPYGKKASTTPFPGSVKQQITTKTLNYSSLIGGTPIDPRVNDRIHDDGNQTVHAPN